MLRVEQPPSRGNRSPVHGGATLSRPLQQPQSWPIHEAARMSKSPSSCKLLNMLYLRGTNRDALCRPGGAVRITLYWLRLASPKQGTSQDQDNSGISRYGG